MELLIVLAVIAILLGIGFITYTRLNQRLSLESATSELSQVLGQARGNALKSGNNFRVLVQTKTRYVVQEDDGGTWNTRRTVNLPTGMTITIDETPSFSTAADPNVEFDTRGFANFNPQNVRFFLTDGRDTKIVAPAMSGNTRIQ